MKYYIGIDPGQKGAIAILNNQNNRITVVDMPLYPNNEINAIALFDFFESEIFNYCSPDCFCALEKAQAMPRQGVTSCFTYGKGYGKIQGVLECLGIPYHEVRPQKWKKHFSLITKNKKASVTTALKLFPDSKLELVTKRGALKDGRAEALLLSLYGRNIDHAKR